MANDSEHVKVTAGCDDRTSESEPAAIVWPTDFEGASTIRMQVLTDVPGTAATVDTVFSVSDGSGYKFDPFVTDDANSAGWGVAWLESPEPGSPAQVKFTFVDRLGDHASELTVHEESKTGATIHQHDVVLCSFGSPDPSDPVRLMIDGINVVWISTELGPQDDAASASPFGRVMLQRYEIAPGDVGDSIAQYPLEKAIYNLSPTANDNMPVELGYGRSPSVTKLADGETAITWIDEQEQIQGVFISDEVDSSRLSTRIRSLSPGVDQLRLGSSYAQGIGVGIGNMIALEFLRDTKFASLVADVLLPNKYLDDVETGSNTPLQPADKQDFAEASSYENFDASNATIAQAPATDSSQLSLPDAVPQRNAPAPAEHPDNDGRPDAEHSAPMDPAIPVQPATAGLVAPPRPTSGTGINIASLQASDDRAGSTREAIPIIVDVIVDGSGQTNIFGSAFDSSGQAIPEFTVQLSDGIGIVDHPTSAVGRTGYLAVWEEKTDENAPTDIKGRYYSFGDVDHQIAPGLLGAEFSVHAATDDQIEHGAAVTAYVLENESHDQIEIGFQVAYVATDSQAANDEFGTIKVARVIVDADLSDGQSAPLSPAAEELQAESGATSALEDAHILTLAANGRTPAIATLTDGEQIVTWVKDDGKIDGAVLVPSMSADDDGCPRAAFGVAALNLSDVMDDAVVAPHQGQQVLALEERSFILVWIADDGDGGLDIVGKQFTSVDGGQWSPSDTDVFVSNIRTSHDNDQIDFKIWLDDDETGGFAIGYRTESDDGSDYHVNHFGDVAGDNSGHGAGNDAAPTLVVVLDGSNDASFDMLTLKAEYTQPNNNTNDDRSADESNTGNSGSGSDGDNSHDSGLVDVGIGSGGPHSAQIDSNPLDPNKIEDHSYDIWHT